MRLFQLKNAYRYNSDSLFLYDFACRNSSFKSKDLVLDVGCGCGILGLLLVRDFAVKLTSIDIQEQNCEICAKNAKENGLESSVICADFLSFKSEIKFDKIISNPPFYDFGMMSENGHKNISRNGASFGILEFSKSCARVLKNGGELVFCYDARLCDSVMKALLESGLKPVKMSFVFSKASKDAKLALFVAKKGSKTPLSIIAPKFACDESGAHSQWAKEVFLKASLESIDL